MLLNADATELAFHAARVALGGDGLLRNPALKIATDQGQGAEQAIHALRAARKPTRIRGEIDESVLRFVLSPIDAGSEEDRRFRITRRNLGSNQPPMVDSTAPDDAVILVVAFENLLRVTKLAWREFIRDYWIDGPLSWSADRPDSEWTDSFGIPPSLRQQARSVVLLGYQVNNQVRSPFIKMGWDEQFR